MARLRLIGMFWLGIMGGLYAMEGPVGLVKSARGVRPDVLFERFTSNRNGLPDNRIRSIFQDSNGFLWVGTMNGLCKYDGYTFKKFYKSKHAHSISGNWVNAICEDASHNLWIGTLEGLNYFDTKEEKFIPIASILKGKDVSAYQEITALLVDKSGKLWVGTKKGLASFDPETNTFKTYVQAPFHSNISKISQSGGDAIWIATTEGIVRYHTKNERYDYFALKVKPNAYGDRFWSLVEYNNDLYIATAASGLLKLNYQSEGNYGAFNSVNLSASQTENLSNAQIFDICIAKDNAIWLATDRGLAKVENMNVASPKLTFYKNNPTNVHSLSENIVFKVFIDKTNVLWCGTEMGLNKLDLNTLPFHFFTFTNYQDQDQIRSIFTNDGNTIYYGTAKSGFYTYDIRANTSKRFSNQPNYSTLNSHRSILINNREIWLGTLGGIVKLTEHSAVLDSIKGLAVFALLKDSKGAVWIGTNSGLYKINRNGSRNRYFPEPGKPGGLKSKFIRSLYEDHAGRIWIGFENKGISYFDPAQEIFMNLPDQKHETKIFGSTIFSIVEYPRNTLWVGSESGLNKITIRENTDIQLDYTIKTYFEEDGLPDKSVNGILVDEGGFLWISTIKGLLRFDTKNEHFQHFLTNLNFSASCYYKLNNHQLVFGAADGFVIFDPQAVSTYSDPPEVVITDFKLFNKDVSINTEFNGDVVLTQSIAKTAEITLGYRNNVFTLGFAGLHYAGPENNQYAYKMEGFDEDWVFTSASNRSATYTNLNPGTYYFKVKAANSFGNWNTKPGTLKVTILPPPWKTWWAITAYVLIFNLLLFVFIRYILVQSKQKQQIRFHQLERQQLENLNKMKLSFFTDISHEFRTPLSLIVGPVEDLMASVQTSGLVKQKLQLVYRNCKKMLSLIDELMTFQKMDQGMLKLTLVETNAVNLVKEIAANFNSLAAHKKIDFQLATDSDLFPVCIDPGRMEMVVNNLLSNAFKFTPVGGSIHIRMYQTADFPETVFSGETGGKEWVGIAIKDNGKGIGQEEIEHVFERFFQAGSGKTGSGVGLSLAKNIAELHHGTITVESEPDVATIFTLFLPLANADVSEKVGFRTPENETSFIQEIPKKTDSLVTIPLMNKMLDEDDLEKPTVLLVDDNFEVLEFLEMIFNDQYRILKAESGEEALAKIKNREPDLIISDVMMPGMDGIELCRIVKDQVSTFHIPVILLTAKSTTDDAIKGIELGADDYIPKPFRPDYLRIRAEKLIEKQKRLMDKLRSNTILVPGDLDRNPLDDVFLQKVIDCIKKNISNEEFSVEELGTMVGMSRSNLFRRIKAITGQTPIEVICYIRLKHSIELLLGRKLNVSEIAYEVGFKNPSSFSKSFKKQFGKAPSDYLNDLLSNELN